MKKLIIAMVLLMIGMVVRAEELYLYPVQSKSGSAVITTNTQYVFVTTYARHGMKVAIQNVGDGDNLVYNVFGVTASITELNGSKYIAQGAERLFPCQVTTLNIGVQTEGSPVTFSYTAYVE